jgi:hypothetical protein
MTITELAPATLGVTTQWTQYKLQHLLGQSYGTKAQHEEIIFMKEISQNEPKYWNFYA